MMVIIDESALMILMIFMMLVTHLLLRLDTLLAMDERLANEMVATSRGLKCQISCKRFSFYHFNNNICHPQILKVSSRSLYLGQGVKKL